MGDGLEGAPPLLQFKNVGEKELLNKKAAGKAWEIKVSVNHER